MARRAYRSIIRTSISELRKLINQHFKSVSQDVSFLSRFGFQSAESIASRIDKLEEMYEIALGVDNEFLQYKLLRIINRALFLIRKLIVGKFEMVSKSKTRSYIETVRALLNSSEGIPSVAQFLEMIGRKEERRSGLPLGTIMGEVGGWKGEEDTGRVIRYAIGRTKELMKKEFGIFEKLYDVYSKVIQMENEEERDRFIQSAERVINESKVALEKLKEIVREVGKYPNSPIYKVVQSSLNYFGRVFEGWDAIRGIEAIITKLEKKRR